MFKYIKLFHRKFGLIISFLVFGLGMSYLFWKLKYPSLRVQTLIEMGVSSIKLDKAVLDNFGNINSVSLDSNEIGIEAGTNKRTPGEARIVLKVYGEKKDGYVKIFYIQVDSKWVYQKHEILGSD
ncbi:MAG: hypothetical protein MUC59_15665 [Saprospiraceae bacterium]|jgi:hypothetical protein|nr:hypothetical protein [Saprospiraceae bacterium]